MAQASQQVVTDRKKSTARVLRLVRRNAASTARALRKLLTPELEEGRPMPDLRAMQELMGRALERRLRRLVETDDVLRRLVREDGKMLRQRDASLSELGRELGDLRTLLTGRLGLEPARNFLGLRGETSRDPIVLLKQADRAVSRLRNFEKQPAGAELSELDRERWAQPLEEQANALREIDRGVRMSAKGLDAARMDRRRALADFNEKFVAIGGWFEGLYRVIGRDDLADAVRPSKQYPGRTAAEMKERLAPAPVEADAVARLLSFEPLRRVGRALGLEIASADGGR